MSYALWTRAFRRQRLHHAYLFYRDARCRQDHFARILAKSLNCECGVRAILVVPARPGCLEIDSGRFVDCFEVDAATEHSCR